VNRLVSRETLIVQPLQRADDVALRQRKLVLDHDMNGGMQARLRHRHPELAMETFDGRDPFGLIGRKPFREIGRPVGIVRSHGRST